MVARTLKEQRRGVRLTRTERILQRRREEERPPPPKQTQREREQSEVVEFLDKKIIESRAEVQRLERAKEERRSVKDFRGAQEIETQRSSKKVELNRASELRELSKRYYLNKSEVRQAIIQAGRRKEYEIRTSIPRERIVREIPPTKVPARVVPTREEGVSRAPTFREVISEPPITDVREFLERGTRVVKVPKKEVAPSKVKEVVLKRIVPTIFKPTLIPLIPSGAELEIGRKVAEKIDPSVKRELARQKQESSLLKEREQRVQVYESTVGGRIELPKKEYDVAQKEFLAIEKIEKRLEKIQEAREKEPKPKVLKFLQKPLFETKVGVVTPGRIVQAPLLLTEAGAGLFEEPVTEASKFLRKIQKISEKEAVEMGYLPSEKIGKGAVFGAELGAFFVPVWGEAMLVGLGERGLEKAIDPTRRIEERAWGLGEIALASVPLGIRGAKIIKKPKIIKGKIPETEWRAIQKIDIKRIEEKALMGAEFELVGVRPPRIGEVTIRGKEWFRKLIREEPRIPDVKKLVEIEPPSIVLAKMEPAIIGRGGRILRPIKEPRRKFVGLLKVKATPGRVEPFDISRIEGQVFRETLKIERLIPKELDLTTRKALKEIEKTMFPLPKKAEITFGEVVTTKRLKVPKFRLPSLPPIGKRIVRGRVIGITKPVFKLEKPLERTTFESLVGRQAVIEETFPRFKVPKKIPVIKEKIFIREKDFPFVEEVFLKGIKEPKLKFKLPKIQEKVLKQVQIQEKSLKKLRQKQIQESLKAIRKEQAKLILKGELKPIVRAKTTKQILKDAGIVESKVLEKLSQPSRVAPAVISPVKVRKAMKMREIQLPKVTTKLLPKEISKEVTKTITKLVPKLVPKMQPKQTLKQIIKQILKQPPKQIIKPPRVPSRFRIPKVPRIPKIPIIIPTLPRIKVKKKKKKKRSIYAYTPDFTAKALGIKPFKVTVPEAEVLVRKIQTGFGVRRGARLIR